jgi:hypothetical protein
MANPSKQKGTKWETELLDRLRGVFGPTVERSSLSGINDYGDYVNVPHLIEAKSTMRPMFQQWARTCEKKAGKAWAIIWHGDRRVQTGSGPYVVMPLELWEVLAADLDRAAIDRLGGRR